LVELGFPPDHISTIEMGLDFEPIDPAPSEEPRFLVLSRLVPHKRVDLALRIWDDVRPMTGGTLVIVGDGPELERLRSMSGPGVEFLGWVDEDKKREELSKAWLLVHPAHHEGWGTVVMEAAAASVPTLAFDVAGVRDSVDHRRTRFRRQVDIARVTNRNSLSNVSRSEKPRRDIHLGQSNQIV
jgi:glycosyltransferase involved in cell wall biosynthesis